MTSAAALAASAELTTRLLDAGIAEVERVARERGLDAGAFAGELLAQGYTRMWDGSDVEAMRRAAHQAVDGYADALARARAADLAKGLPS